MTVAPHPDVDTLRTGAELEVGPASLSPDPVVVGPLSPQVDLQVAVEGGVVLDLTEGGVPLLGVAVDADEVRLSVPGGSGSRLPSRPDGDGVVRLRLLLDAGVVELFTGGATAAARLRPSGGEISLGIAGDRPGARLRGLVAHAMERVVG
ncbi:hypothetical protein [Blastococcus sp. PRF04-17]|uniref:hypothetical protein n=1 Tax=Blastococcus sp. PRF04-17 TaxID=2933797 RepID=UPI001FF5BDE0|nr:hypothetical protein [Blastococcus sp. PRF04-17]UOY02888.1 hypothetical protein MVA48_05905 [Blastococcus sp. PRF04-17]